MKTDGQLKWFSIEPGAYFPIQGVGKIPWAFAAKAYKKYVQLFGGNQSLERLAERGGFGWQEFVHLFNEKTPIGLLDAARSDEMLKLVLADRDHDINELYDALERCVTAMRLWGSMEDGVPEPGHDAIGAIGVAFDNAVDLLDLNLRLKRRG